MKRKPIYAIILSLIILTITLTVFQNCGENFDLQQYQQSSEAPLDNIAYAVPAVVSNSGDPSVASGQPVTLWVAASGGDLSYEWYKGTTQLSEATNTYNISSVTATSVGTYSVKIKNSLGEVTFNFTVSINSGMATTGAAKIITPPKNASILAGMSVSFYVVAEGAAPLTYQWYFKSISAGAVESAIAGATASEYKITSATIGRSGTYRVAVANSLATVSASANLFVERAGGPGPQK